MIYFIYQLNFNDGSKYIGQTNNLNNRVEAHKSIWKFEHEILISSVDIIKTVETRQEALMVENFYIEEIGLDNLRNKVFSSLGSISEGGHTIDMLSNRKIYKPALLLELGDKLNDEDKKRFLTKRISNLENKYISTFYELKIMRDNIEGIDILVDEAIKKGYM